MKANCLWLLSGLILEMNNVRNSDQLLYTN